MEASKLVIWYTIPVIIPNIDLLYCYNICTSSFLTSVQVRLKVCVPISVPVMICHLIIVHMFCFSSSSLCFCGSSRMSVPGLTDSRCSFSVRSLSRFHFILYIHAFIMGRFSELLIIDYIYRLHSHNYIYFILCCRSDWSFQQPNSLWETSGNGHWVCVCVCVCVDDPVRVMVMFCLSCRLRSISSFSRWRPGWRMSWASKSNSFMSGLDTLVLEIWRLKSGVW